MDFIDNLYIRICLMTCRFKEKAKSFLEAEDGISNVVSTVLLILIVVLLIGLLWGFLSGFLGDLIGKIWRKGDEIETTGSWSK